MASTVETVNATKDESELVLWQPYKDLALAIENDSLTSTAVTSRQESEEESEKLNQNNTNSSAASGSTNISRAQNSVYRDWNPYEIYIPATDFDDDQTYPTIERVYTDALGNNIMVVFNERLYQDPNYETGANITNPKSFEIIEGPSTINIESITFPEPQYPHVIALKLDKSIQAEEKYKLKFANNSLYTPITDESHQRNRLQDTTIDVENNVSQPTVNISSEQVDTGQTSSDPFINLTFTLSESTSDFTIDDITVENGSFTGGLRIVNGSTYQTTLKPDQASATRSSFLPTVDSGNTGSGNEDATDPISETLVVTDPDGLTGKDSNGTSYTIFKINSQPSNGTAAIEGESPNNPASVKWTYQPNENFSGEDSFEISITDDNGGISYETINVNIAAENDATEITGDVTSTGNEDNQIKGVITLSDIDGLTNGSIVAISSTASNKPQKGDAVIAMKGKDDSGNLTAEWTYTPQDLSLIHI